ncbi:MAG: hypothetical protein EON47_19905 [Acetobacteraceae bacterium]|nr:MAG: hypothetical protein EON47_19905 [Acetobacteraceae bacterium]
MLRILQIIAGPAVKLRPANAPAAMEKGEGKLFLDWKNQNILYWFRGPRHWTADVDLGAFRTVMHFRDPRDLACNQYWWALQHPNTIDSPEVAEEKRAKVEAEGIDRYALGRNNSANYAAMREASEGPFGPVITWTSYTQLCCAFDYMTDNLCRMFHRAPSRVAEELRIERPENLAGNADWVKVGGTWKGSDITPGRFRRDLQPETIAAMNKKLARDLEFCRNRDAAFLAHHYS